MKTWKSEKITKYGVWVTEIRLRVCDSNRQKTVDSLIARVNKESIKETVDEDISGGDGIVGTAGNGTRFSPN